MIRLSFGAQIAVAAVVFTFVFAVACAIWTEQDPDIYHAAPAAKEPTDLDRLLRPALERSRKDRIEACVEITEPAEAAGWYCVRFSDMKPRGRYP